MVPAETVEDGCPSLWSKNPGNGQEVLGGCDPEWFSVPLSAGCQRWNGVRLDVTIDWDALIEEIHRMTPLKPLDARLEQR